MIWNPQRMGEDVHFEASSKCLKRSLGSEAEAPGFPGAGSAAGLGEAKHGDRARGAGGEVKAESSLRVAVVLQKET